MAKKYCYLFSEGNANMRELLGGKGANLAEMTNIGLPVPQGFTITTEACTQYYEDGREINPEIMAEINEYIVKMEGITGKKFGDKKNPLLVSVRSGARASMPGMMDTILNLGLNEEVVNTISEMSGNPRWAWDCYRRFIQMYSDVVMEVGKKYFEELLERIREIRLSERKFYQKITDIYATAIDYDSKAETTRRFFSAVQNKIHYAIHGNTAAEVIYNRADAAQEHMGLTTWEGAPNGKIHKYDVVIAKNYLSKKELANMGRLVNAYLDLAELQAERNIPMTMKDWENRLNGFLQIMDYGVLSDNGKVSAEMARIHAESEFEKYRKIQDVIYESDFDRFMELEDKMKNDSDREQ